MSQAWSAALAGAAGLRVLDQLDSQVAEEHLLRCCGSTRWAHEMSKLRPFGTTDNLSVAAQAKWWSLGPQDWGEAFAAHPRIGDKEQLRQKYAATAQGAQAGSG